MLCLSYKKKRILIIKDSTSLTSLGLSDAVELALAKASLNKLNLAVHSVSGPELNLLKLEILLKKLGPELIFFGEANIHSVPLLQFIRTKQSQAVILGGCQFGIDSTIKAYASKLPPNTLYYSAPWHLELESKYNQYFLSYWNELFPKSEAKLKSALLFESLQILYGASRVAKHPKNPLALVQILTKMNFPSTSGALKFPSYTHHAAPRDVYILSFEGSKIKPVKTVRLKWNPNP